MFKSNFHAVIIAVLILLSTIANAQRPNVIFILTDDQNKNTVGCYDGLVSTPAIDKLAEEGIKFTNANVVSTICSPSRYTILTGRYYSSAYTDEFLKKYPYGKVNSVGNQMQLENDNMNVASILKNNGYRTGYVGKFHLTRHDLLATNRLWEENGLKTYPRNSDPREDKETNEKLNHNHRFWCNEISKFGFDYVNGIYAGNTRELFNANLIQHNVEWTIDAALKFIDSNEQNDRPFFLVVATTYPHGPAPERVVGGQYPNSLDADIHLTGEGYIKDEFDCMPSRESIKKKYQEMKNENPGLPGNAITALWWDSAVDAIVKRLENKKLEKNTLIIYTSDHGLINHGKSTLYENGVSVPLIASWPAKIKKGFEYSHLIGSVDYVPTILEACKAKIPNEMKIDGLSFYSVLNGDTAATRESLFLEMGYAKAVKTERYKYIAVRYSKEIEAGIKNGQKFERGKLAQPYLIDHKNLAEKAASANPFYFDRNQVFDMVNDKEESENIYGKDKDVDEKMKELLSNELKKFPKRPFGEFN